MGGSGPACYIWMQVISWWPYHYLLLFVARGCWRRRESICCGSRRPLRRFRVGDVQSPWTALLLLSSALCPGRSRRRRRWWLPSSGHAPLPLDSASMRVYQAAHNQDYADALATTSFPPGAGQLRRSNLRLWQPEPCSPAAQARHPALRCGAPVLTAGGLESSHGGARGKRHLPTSFVNDQALESNGRPSLPGPWATEVSALPSRLGRRYQKFRTTDAGGTWYLRLDLARREQSGTSTPTTNLVEGRPHRGDALALPVLVVVAGGLCLARPIGATKPCSTVYAHQTRLTRAVLSRDVFDVKQPGIFLFYALGRLVLRGRRGWHPPVRTALLDRLLCLRACRATSMHDALGAISGAGLTGLSRLYLYAGLLNLT